MFINKFETIQFVIGKYIDYEGEPELKPEFIKLIQKIQNQKSIAVEDFAKRYGLK